MENGLQLLQTLARAWCSSSTSCSATPTGALTGGIQNHLQKIGVVDNPFPSRRVAGVIQNADSLFRQIVGEDRLDHLNLLLIPSAKFATQLLNRAAFVLDIDSVETLRVLLVD